MNFTNVQKTPTLDALAQQSLSFSNCFTTSAVCSTSRYSILTGRYFWRGKNSHGISNVLFSPMIEEGVVTIPQVLSDNGYRTHFLGKWHMGLEYGPFDFSRYPYFRTKESYWTKRGQHWRENGFIRDDTVSRLRINVGTSLNRRFSLVDYTLPMRRGAFSFFDKSFWHDAFNYPPYGYIRDNQTLGVKTGEGPGRVGRNNNHIHGISGDILDDYYLEDVVSRMIDEGITYIEELEKSDNFLLYYCRLHLMCQWHR